MEHISLSPAEAASLTGVMPATQRDWRRHRFLSASSEGWTRFDALGIAELFLLKTLAEHSKLKEVSEAARALAAPLGDYFNAGLNGEETQAPANAAVVWADGSVNCYPTVQDAFNQALPQQQAGPVTVFSLSVLAVPFWIQLRDFLNEEGELVS